MDVFLVICAAIFMVLIIDQVSKKYGHYNVLQESFSINYPLEPMLENFADIQIAIDQCTNIKMLNAVFIRIIIFQGCYSDSEVFYTDLMHQFGDKEIEINSIKM